ncbi:hypothetical protein [Limnohabitans sp. T6-20]|uniref:hypothetical protein n=1 Tax=Limnohabitans sp. T6-20 TaxID=1100725 RepID=UPI0011B1CFAB|nr:hypothetical protein [Limnohabitans sp. T6-20]
MKNIAGTYFGKHWWLLVIPLMLYAFIAFREIGLPGLYMDSVNPDYMAAWLLRGNHHIPVWIFPDNYFAGTERYPLLNSLYGGNITAYIGLIFFKITGFGLVEVRIFHALLGMLVLVSLSWCLHKWQFPRFVSSFALCLLAIDPTFLFAWRLQYYLQLFPLIFMFVGLGLLGEHYKRIKLDVRGHHNLFFAGIFLGLSAYSYFIFAFYSAVIVTMYINHCRHHLSLRSIVIPLVMGAGLGWLPYIYAHASLILITDFHAYQEMLRGLQTSYGVIDQNQGGIIDRLHIVAERFSSLVAGRALQINVFGNWVGSGFLILLHWLIFISGPVILVIYYIVRLVWQLESMVDWCEKPLWLFAKIMTTILIIHVIFGLIVGRPLGLQHYVMLLPIMYSMTAAAIVYLWQTVINLQYYLGVSRGVMASLFVGMIATNYSLSWDLIDRLKQTGGSRMYSDVINVAASHIQNLNSETILLFPQWGYWMGVVTITGPRFSSYEALSLNEMQVKLNNDTKLIKQQSFAMIIGEELLKNGTEETRKKLEKFVESSGLEIINITYCLGRNGVDQIWLIQMTRKETQKLYN